MRPLLSLIFCVLLSVPAFAAPPTKEAIDKLLVAMDIPTMVTKTQNQLDAAMKSGIQMSTKGQTLSPDAVQKLDVLQKNCSSILADALSWENMQKLYFQVYSETFSEEEIEGMTAFYQSPAGKAFVEKMPLAMKKTMAIMQQRMRPIIQTMQKSIEDTTKAVVTVKEQVIPAQPAPATQAVPAAHP